MIALGVLFEMKFRFKFEAIELRYLFGDKEIKNRCASLLDPTGIVFSTEG